MEGRKKGIRKKENKKGKGKKKKEKVDKVLAFAYMHTHKVFLSCHRRRSL